MFSFTILEPAFEYGIRTKGVGGWGDSRAGHKVGCSVSSAPDPDAQLTKGPIMRPIRSFLIFETKNCLKNSFESKTVHNPALLEAYIKNKRYFFYI